MSIRWLAASGKQMNRSIGTLKRSNQIIGKLYSTNQTQSSSKPVPLQVRSRNLGRSSNSSDRVKGGKKDTLWQSWSNLTLGTKMGVAFGIGLFGVIGLLASDYLERTMPAQGTTIQGQDHTRKPRLLGISVVDREEKKI